MNGHVFQCYREATEKNQFARTVKELDACVGSHFKEHASDIKKMIKSMEDTTIDLPKDHEEKASKIIIRIWEKEVDLYVKRKETYDSNKCALLSVLWGQCSKAMQAKTKSDDNYETLDQNSNSLDRLKEIKGVSCKFENQQDIYLALDNVKSLFYTCQQAGDETNANCVSNLKKFDRDCRIFWRNRWKRQCIGQ
jgi:hypothetical protein